MERSPHHWQCHEGSLVLPQGYQDRTVNLFTPATPSAPILNIVRDQLDAEETLTQWIDHQLTQLAAQLADWRQQAREPVWLGAQRVAGECFHCDYRYQGARLWQQQAVFNPADTQLLIFSMTHSAPLQAADTQVFHGLLRSFTAHQPSG
ncbi:DcrB-related protein [Erwinia sp. V71]|uniref:DcrB-related protein n=1 Tax=Erwinia sp. V71 TaxID=3369424 RepID=UPI003F5D69BC